ncbi:MAG: RHS repeat-associated core domain-containing protein, partial [Nanoarchaeota archaeon]
KDNLGSTRVVTDSTGSKLEESNYLPYGENLENSDETFGFTGKEQDLSGLTYFGARYYDPSLGVFVTVDPIGDGINWYEYAASNPVNRIDSLGLQDVLPGFDLDEEDAEVTTEFASSDVTTVSTIELLSELSPDFFIVVDMGLTGEDVDYLAGNEEATIDDKAAIFGAIDVDRSTEDYFRENEPLVYAHQDYYEAMKNTDLVFDQIMLTANYATEVGPVLLMGFAAKPNPYGERGKFKVKNKIISPKMKKLGAQARESPRFAEQLNSLRRNLKFGNFGAGTTKKTGVGTVRNTDVHYVKHNNVRLFYRVRGHEILHIVGESTKKAEQQAMDSLREVKMYSTR